MSKFKKIAMAIKKEANRGSPYGTTKIDLLVDELVKIHRDLIERIPEAEISENTPIEACQTRAMDAQIKTIRFKQSELKKLNDI